MMRMICFLIFSLLIFDGSAYAQSLKKNKFKETIRKLNPRNFLNPKITVPIKHPAKQKLPLDRVMFVPVGGEGATALVDKIVPHFIARDSITVVDRKNLDLLALEQEFTMSGQVQDSMVIGVGKKKGASTMFIVKILKNEISNQEVELPIKGKINYQTIVTLEFEASIQALDITTTEMKAAQTVRKRLSSTNTSPHTYLMPSTKNLVSDAISQVAFEISKFYMPWTEMHSLTFFKDKYFNMREAYHALESDDLEYAWELTVDGLAEARSDRHQKAKFRARAHHNMAMLYFMHGEFQKAIANLREAGKIKPDHIFREAQAEIRHAVRLQKELTEDGEQAIELPDASQLKDATDMDKHE